MAIVSLSEHSKNIRSRIEVHFHSTMAGTNNFTTPLESDSENNKLELERKVLLFVYGVIGLLAVLSNVSLCAVLLRNRHMLQRAYNIIIFTLAAIDTLTGKLTKLKCEAY